MRGRLEGVSRRYLHFSGASSREAHPSPSSVTVLVFPLGHWGVRILVHRAEVVEGKKLLLIWTQLGALRRPPSSQLTL